MIILLMLYGPLMMIKSKVISYFLSISYDQLRLTHYRHEDYIMFSHSCFDAISPILEYFRVAPICSLKLQIAPCSLTTASRKKTF